MPFSIGDLLRSPSDLAAAARSVLGWTDEAVQVVADLPARVAALLDEAERLVTRVGDTLDRVDDVTGRVDAVVDPGGAGDRERGARSSSGSSRSPVPRTPCWSRSGRPVPERRPCSRSSSR